MKTRKKHSALLATLFSMILFGSLMAQTDDGFVQLFHSNGKVASEGLMKNGKPEGLWKNYTEEGQLKSEGNRVNHQLDGIWKFYGENGNIELEVTYREGKKEGPKNSYDTTGQLTMTEAFHDDVKDGPTMHYYAGGATHKFIPFVTGKEEGTGYEYDKDGTIITIWKFQKGFMVKQEKINRKDKNLRKQGRWKDFYENGQMKWEGDYKDDLRHGIFKYYSPEGNLLDIKKYENGVELKDVDELVVMKVKEEYDDSARVRSRGTYNKDGKPEGIFKEYGPDGSIVSTTVYSQGTVIGQGLMDGGGIKQGPWEENWPNGNIRARGTYKNGKKVGKWQYYHDNGQLEQTGEYVDGKPHKEWKWYYRDGKPLRIEQFRLGKEDGEFVEYGDSGQVITKGEYLDGYKEGPWVYELEHYREEGQYKDGQKDGVWKHFHKNGELRFEGEFLAGIPMGKHKWYYDNKRLKEEGKYKSGRKSGKWIKYNPDGSILVVIQFKQGAEVKIDGVKVKPESPAYEDL
ncbi:MAG: toxin-antitoxin system YwqK family antitoxin [Flavobacteriales bacterium]|nr:toxin-antitoxin system YwqK family antitoxin [Flavobacteriales bacterium]